MRVMNFFFGNPAGMFGNAGSLNAGPMLPDNQSWPNQDSGDGFDFSPEAMQDCQAPCQTACSQGHGAQAGQGLQGSMLDAIGEELQDLDPDSKAEAFQAIADLMKKLQSLGHNHGQGQQ